MKKILPLVFLFLITANLFGQQSSAKFTGFKQAQTRHFRFIFEEEGREAAENYALYADEAWNKIANIYSVPKDKIDIYITARTNTVNAFTYIVPPEIKMFNSPVLTPDFGFRDNWQKLFFTHELVHEANIVFESKPYVGAKLFGDFSRSLNFSSVPTWAIEGLATVLESELTDGGRGRSPYFELKFKASTIDNGFISYDEISTGEEPPAGPAYIMGYMIMRSIADRWGIEALADIERNRTFDWEESVKNVTGKSAQDIYLESRAALSKIYSKERSIPEGKIISPREEWHNYYTPALVLDDSSMVLLKSENGTASVIHFRPNAKDGCLSYTEVAALKKNKISSDKKNSGDTENGDAENVEGQEKESDKKNDDVNVKETLLFSGEFPDEFAMTADKNLNVYSVQPKYFYDRAPGFAIEYPLFVWNEKDGLRQLTEDISLFQPSVSRDGSLLVALKQVGLKSVLVKVDTKTGEISSLYEDEKNCIAQPAVNADGSKIAFLSLTGERAVLQVLDVATMKVQSVFNNEKEIFDPAYPSWNSDGTLTFTSNNRGRLEVYQYNEVSKKAEVVLSDPVGALWAYTTKDGILYSSYSSTGYVLKIKPASEWKKVPDFEGPFKAGQMMSFAKHEEDYPDFNPFNEGPSDELEKRSAWYKYGMPEDFDGDEKKLAATFENGKVSAYTEVITTLQDEKAFHTEVKPVLYFPFIAFADGISNSTYFGFGYNFFAYTSRQSPNSGFILSGLYYFPAMKNFSGLFFAEVPVRTGLLDFSVLRSVGKKSSIFCESNQALLAYTLPLYKRGFSSWAYDISLVAESGVEALRYASVDFSAFPDQSSGVSSYIYGANAQLGLDASFANYTDETSSKRNMSAYLLASWNSSYNKIYPGVEALYSAKVQHGMFNVFYGLKGRYQDCSLSTITPSFTNVTFGGEKTNSLYPGHLVAEVGLNFGGFRITEEAMINFGTSSLHGETPDNGTFFNAAFEKELITNYTLVLLENGRNSIDVGLACSYDFDTKKYEYKNLFFNIHWNWLRM